MLRFSRAACLFHSGAPTKSNSALSVVKLRYKALGFLGSFETALYSENGFKAAVGLQKRKQNIILQWLPSLGRTFVTRKFSYELMGEEKDVQIEVGSFTNLTVVKTSFAASDNKKKMQIPPPL